MDKKPIISIIIPVYNAEKTIKRTIESLTNNQYNIEIICVNDGSKDKSRLIINELIKSDKRIMQIVQDNKGVSAARNLGLALASGNHIMFCDADDEFDKDVLRCVQDDIYTYNPDYVVFGRYTILENGAGYNWINNSAGNTRVLECDWINYLNDIIIKRRHSYVVYNRVYKKSLITEHEIKFSESLALSEDLYFNFNYLRFAKTFVEDTRCNYIQHKVSNSLTTSKRPYFFEQNTQVLSEIKKELDDQAFLIQPFFDYFYLNSIVLSVDRALRGRDANSLMEASKIIQRVINNPEFTGVYERFHYNLDPKLQAKLGLLRNRRIVSYWTKYIVVPKAKGKLLSYGQRKKSTY